MKEVIDYLPEIDVVYVLGKGSIWYNNELRFSLRSLEKYLTGYRNIWIVGECPTFIKDLHWIKMADVGHNKEMRIMNKVAQACLNHDISEEFLFMNDDHFFLKEVDARDYPFYHKGLLQHCIADRNAMMEYTRAMVNTQNALAKIYHDNNGFHVINNFDIHTPIRYRKDHFLNAMDNIDWTVKDGYIIKSLYAGLNLIDGMPDKDNKISQFLGREQFLERLHDQHIFSVADTAINDHSIQIFKELYPTKSKWEL